MNPESESEIGLLRKAAEILVNKNDAANEKNRELMVMVERLTDERDAALEREQALAAHVEQLRGALRPLAYGGASDCIARGDFSVMRERLKDSLGVRDFKNARSAFDSTPATGLARLSRA